MLLTANSLVLHIACRHVEAASDLTKGRPNTSAIALDVKDSAALLQAVSGHDVVIRFDSQFR